MWAGGLQRVGLVEEVSVAFAAVEAKLAIIYYLRVAVQICARTMKSCVE